MYTWNLYKFTNQCHLDKLKKHNPDRNQENLNMEGNLSERWVFQEDNAWQETM